MQDPQYQLFLLKRQFLEEGPESISTEHLEGLLAYLPAKDVRDLISFFHDRSMEQSLGILAKIATLDARVEVRNHALSLISMDPNGRNQYLQLFEENLGGGRSEYITATVVKALGSSDKELTFGVFKPFLTHSDGRVRANCVEGLRYRSVPGLRPLLELLLDDPCPRVRAEAALSLWKMGNPSILGLLRDAEDPRERLSYIRVLGRTGRSEQVMNLLWDFYSGDDEDEASAAAESLLELQSEAMIPRIVSMSIHGPSSFRKRLFDLCLAKDRVAVVAELSKNLSELMQSSSSAHPRALATVLSLLKRSGEVGDVDLVLACVDSDDARVAANAVETLQARCTAPNVRAALLRAMRLGTPRMKVNASVVLWQTGLVAAVSELKAMLDDGDANVRAGGVYGLGSIGGIVAKDAIVSMLSDPSEGVRNMAARFLS